MSPTRMDMITTVSRAIASNQRDLFMNTLKQQGCLEPGRAMGRSRPPRERGLDFIPQGRRDYPEDTYAV